MKILSSIQAEWALRRKQRDERNAEAWLKMLQAEQFSLLARLRIAARLIARAALTVVGR